ncbi:di-trans,poly-cis-decaprenylcistransferase [Belnapia sp. T6]|uniref:Isoprenyl transferase n=1 Tax=Belnapia mucosa TaxID=2804532 RepID=A0ABS1V419_9PROT|nr:di-trans,poly-cis-decaprenylcistransferase [Belnapia mucosa]
MSGAPKLQSLPEAAPPGALPQHVAIIMDGNRRWAEARGLPVALGHKAGAEAVRRTIQACAEQGIGWLTLFAFSSENWLRPPEEVTALTGLLRLYLRSEVATFAREGIRLRVIGDRARFGVETMREIDRAEAVTAGGTRLNVNVALSYGARDEILAAARAVAEAARAGTLDPASLDETAFAARLFTAGMPDPDLIIRTSGEQRLSNFLLWQAAYAEFVFQEVLWPDYGAEHLARALRDYGRRERRFGARPG